MDINKEWEKAGEGTDPLLSSMLNMTTISRLSSKDPLIRLRRAVLFNACWGLLISIGYIVVLCFYPLWQLLVCCGMILVITLGAVYKTFVLYANLGRRVVGAPVLQEMERHYVHIRRWMRLQTKVCLLIFPPSIVGGFLWGGSLGSGVSIERFIRLPGIIWVLIGLLVIFVPAGYFFARWMSYRAFGIYADQLRDNIAALKTGAWRSKVREEELG